MGDEEGAAESAERAAALDCGRTAEVGALARRARCELAARRRRDAARFGGLFSSKKYAAAAAATAVEAAAADEKDRRRVASSALARHVVDEAEREAMEAWCALGPVAVQAAVTGGELPAHRLHMMRLVRRAAVEGSLENGEARTALRMAGLAGGLAAAGDPSAEGLDVSEELDAPHRARLERIRGLVAQAKNGQPLSADELALLAYFRAEEVARLVAQRGSPDGLSQADEALLIGLQAQQAAAAVAAARDARCHAETSEALARLQAGAHIGPRERYNTLRLLEAEQTRLVTLEEERGLRADELPSLRALRTLFTERSAKERMRAEQQEFLKKIQDAAI
jgi:hypothetical protein